MPVVNKQPSQKLVYETYASSYLNDANYHKLFEHTADHLVKHLNPKTVLELGCGPGVFVSSLLERGVSAKGIDRNRHFKKLNDEHIILADLKTYQIEQPVDMITSIEVFEHMADEELENILSQIAANCKWFVFSSTPHSSPADAEWGHVNIKSKAEWINFFKPYGLKLMHNWALPTHWTMVFKGGIA